MKKEYFYGLAQLFASHSSRCLNELLIAADESVRQRFCTIPQNDELMKQYSLLGLLALATVMALESCRVVGGIFKAGVWVGILLVVLVVGIILWLVGRGRS